MGVDGASESRGLCDAGWNSNHSSWLQVPSLSLQQQWQLAPIPRSLRLSSGLTPPSQHVLLKAFSQLGRASSWGQAAAPYHCLVASVSPLCSSSLSTRCEQSVWSALRVQHPLWCPPPPTPWGARTMH